MGIIQPNIIQPNIIQPNEILFSQMKYYSAKWEYYSAKLRGGWRPKPGASWRNHYIAKYAGRREYYTVDVYKDKSPQLAVQEEHTRSRMRNRRMRNRSRGKEPTRQGAEGKAQSIQNFNQGADGEEWSAY